MRRLLPLSAALAALLLACAACAGPPPGQDGTTFVKAISSDPGKLDPLTAVSPTAREVIAYSYESLVAIDPQGAVSPWLARSWAAAPTEVRFVLRDDVRCSDGTTLTARTVADNIAFHANPDNASFYNGSLVKSGTTATADDARRTVVVRSTTPDPFLLTGIGQVQMVCAAGLANTDSLATRTDGTGMFVLTDAVAEDSYTLRRRDDYTWGPHGLTARTPGVPSTVTLRVVKEQGTAANLLLAGEINAADVAGPDRARLEQAGMFQAGADWPVGEMMFNERAGRPTTDETVRRALLLAVDRDAVRAVLTDSHGTEPRSLVTLPPRSCVAPRAPWSLPPPDPAAAAALLDRAGWTAGPTGERSRAGVPLALTFVYDEGSPNASVAAELLAQNWKRIGVSTRLVGLTGPGWDERLYQTYDWDAGFVQVQTGEPTFLRTFFAGGPPPDGNNFMFVENPRYAQLSTRASAADPRSTCALWQQAEAALVERSDVLPLADESQPIFGNGARFTSIGYLDPTTLRLTGPDGEETR